LASESNKPMPGAARWCFTINNYTPIQAQLLRRLVNGPLAILGIAGFEVGLWRRVIDSPAHRTHKALQTS
jgi:hypothetical protein